MPVCARALGEGTARPHRKGQSPPAAGAEHSRPLLEEGLETCNRYSTNNGERTKKNKYEASTQARRPVGRGNHRAAQPGGPAQIREKKRHPPPASGGQDTGDDLPQVVHAHARVVRSRNVRAGRDGAVFILQRPPDRPRRGHGRHHPRALPLSGRDYDPHLCPERGRGNGRYRLNPDHQRSDRLLPSLSGTGWT